jgi:hypothetical protein
VFDSDEDVAYEACSLDHMLKGLEPHILASSVGRAAVI